MIEQTTKQPISITLQQNLTQKIFYIVTTDLSVLCKSFLVMMLRNDLYKLMLWRKPDEG